MCVQLSDWPETQFKNYILTQTLTCALVLVLIICGQQTGGQWVIVGDVNLWVSFFFGSQFESKHFQHKHFISILICFYLI